MSPKFNWHKGFKCDLFYITQHSQNDSIFRIKDAFIFSHFFLLVYSVNELNRAVVGFHEYSVLQSASGDGTWGHDFRSLGKKSLFSVLF